MFFTREDREKFESKGAAAKFAVHLEQKYGLQLNAIGQRDLADEIRALIDSELAAAQAESAVSVEGES